MTSTNKMSRKARQRENADILFMVYRFMGVDRTLTKLCENIRNMGVRISLKTLERYSKEYEWQRRLLELNAEEIQRKEKGLQVLVEKMNDRHAKFAQALLGLVAGGLNSFQQMMLDTSRGKTLNMMIQEMISLFKTAQVGERLARGEAISRIEVWIDIASTVVREFALIFLAVNDMEDKELRKQEYIRLSDDMIIRYYIKTVKQGVSIAEKSNG